MQKEIKVRSLYDELLTARQQFKEVNKKVNTTFRKFKIGFGSGGGLYIAKEKGSDSKNVVDQVNGIDIEAAAYIIHRFVAIYGEEALEKASRGIHDSIIFYENMKDGMKDES